MKVRIGSIILRLAITLSSDQIEVWLKVISGIRPHTADGSQYRILFIGEDGFRFVFSDEF